MRTTQPPEPLPGRAQGDRSTGIVVRVGAVLLERYRRAIDWPEFLGLLAVAFVIWLLWHTRAVYPLKILVVFFHELSHGLAALLTGGRIVEIRLMANEGGHCVTAGGSRFLIISAGYLGSLVFGGAILLASRSPHDRLVSVALGAVLLLVSLAWVRPVIGFGFLFSVLAGAAAIAAGVHLPAMANELLNKTIGLASCMYAVMDILSDTVARPHTRSDAAMLAELTGIPAILWGLLWIAVALAVSLLLLAAATCRLRAEQ